MLRISAGLATCLAAVVTAGCGTVPVPHSGSGALTPAHVKARNQGPVSTVAPTRAGTSPGCRSPASAGPAARIFVITLAGNETTYCVRVGDKVRVDLRGTYSSPWPRPLVTGDALTPVPDAAAETGVTSASFAAVRPGRVLMTSVRPPCQVAVPSAKNELEPAFPLPKVYPPRSCAAGHRFITSVMVLR
jgi:hypothetical protein